MPEPPSLGIEPSAYHVCSKTGIEFAVIPAGPFYAGPLSGEKLTSPAFEMARHPVTNAQWQQFVQETDYWPEQRTGLGAYLQHWNEKKRTPPAKLAQHPVTWISFIDALHFAAWADVQIPSEWHWEKAARGVDGRQCPWGDYVGWATKFSHVQQRGTAPVDFYSHVRTAFGCEQMIGNVAEFCVRADVPVGDFLPTPNINSVADTDLVVLRGGCYFRKSPRAMICSHRRKLSAGRRNSWTGLRVLRRADRSSKLT